MTQSLENPAGASTAAFDLRTERSDDTRVSLVAKGDLHAGGAAVLAEVIDGHLRAGRRFLRLNVAGLSAISPAAAQVIAAAHERGA